MLFRSGQEGRRRLLGPPRRLSRRRGSGEAVRKSGPPRRPQVAPLAAAARGIALEPVSRTHSFALRLRPLIPSVARMPRGGSCQGGCDLLRISRPTWSIDQDNSPGQPVPVPEIRNQIPTALPPAPRACWVARVAEGSGFDPMLPLSVLTPENARAKSIDQQRGKHRSGPRPF